MLSEFTFIAQIPFLANVVSDGAHEGFSLMPVHAIGDAIASFFIGAIHHFGILAVAKFKSMGKHDEDGAGWPHG